MVSQRLFRLLTVSVPSDDAESKDGCDGEDEAGIESDLDSGHGGETDAIDQLSMESGTDKAHDFSCSDL